MLKVTARKETELGLKPKPLDAQTCTFSIVKLWKKLAKATYES